MNKNSKCVCPYLPCPIHGYCQMCIAVSLNVKAFPNCMEPNVEACGGCLPRKRPKRTIVCDSCEERADKCARLMARIVHEKPDALFCLSAEKDFVRTYEILKEMHDRGEVDFTRAQFVQLTEWLNLEEPEESQGTFLQKSFFEPLGIRKEQIRLFDPMAQDLKKECADMDRFLEENGDIDCMLLGIGPDCQLGFNEPGELFDQGIRVVPLSDSIKADAKKYLTKSNLPNYGITMGMQQIFCSETVIMQAGSKEKAEIMAKTYATLPQIAVPATALMLLRNGIVVMDKEAASLIDEI